MSFDKTKIILIVIAAVLAMVLVGLVVVALSGLGGDGVTQPTTAPTQPSEDVLIETPYGNILFPGRYAPYLLLERSEEPELTLSFVARMESGKTQPLFDLRFGQPIEPAIGQVVTQDGVAVGVYRTVYKPTLDGSWTLRETTLLSEMQELVDDLVDQLELVDLDTPVPDVQEGEVVIETPYCKLYFPERWKEELRITVDKTKGYEVVFSGFIGEHEAMKLFAVNFGGGEETGKLAHTLMTENDVPLQVYLRTFSLNMEGWSAVDTATAKAMQEDVNYLLGKLMEEE